ncbi:MAG: ABC transporter ATP-binding protein [Pseudolabrys sp.]|nr:ABC transporter ATP-binding protein [Pseudolabrys sp.]MDP2297829.1 ABC transporter ATP-binding protein [Pseudolabrys sp.]
MDNDVAEPGVVTVRLNQKSPIPLDAELSVAAGEILALVGPSGSGKTTTLRTIAGLYRPNGGRVMCNGSVWFDSESDIWVPARQRRVGMVLQSYALFPHLSAVENVMEALSDSPAEARRAEAAALLSRMHLDGLADRRPASLSGGQQQRVAVARALARRPEVLLLDEPFSAVDRVTRRRLRAELVELRRELPMPVILVTHDLDDVVRLADRMCVMHAGRILQAGTVEDVMARPDSATVAELLDLEGDHVSATASRN